MKEAPVLIFVMNDLGCRLDHTLSWDERVSEFATPRPLTLPSKMGVLRLTVWSLAVSGSAILILPALKLCHTLKAAANQSVPLPWDMPRKLPLTDCAKAFADAVKFCDSLLGSAKIVPIGWGYLPHCLKDTSEK